MDINSSLSKQKDIRRKSTQLDKICSKLQISVKDQDPENQLSKSVKLRIQKYIENDQVRQLHGFLQKKVLNYDIEIGIKAMRWNILHFAAKNNALKIMQVLLVRTYQQSPQKYKQLVNKQTFEGYTPLIISIIYCARQCFLMLLEYGGSDLQCVDNKNMTAYELALNYKNEFAIRELMSYASANGKRKDGLFVNEDLLSKPIDSSLYSQSNCYSKMFDCFVDFFLCFGHSENDVDQFENQPSNEIKQQQHVPQPQQSFLKNFNGSKLLSYLKNTQQIQIDMVPIGNRQIESKYSIQWKRLSLGNNQKSVLFDCFQPFDICENNLIIANNLMIFQCLSDHTWLVRKIVKQLKKGQGQISNNSNPNDLPNQYSIQLYFNDELKKVTVDEYIPFLKQREQPMFLSNTNQMWPQILQKGLAKIYGSYMKLSEIKPQIFVENLTGFYTKSFPLEEGMNFFKDENGQDIREKPIMNALQDFNSKGYMILLEGREGTTLCPKNTPSAFKSYCYTILNFYQKGSKRLILVNCPYILNSWKQKEKTQIMQLKLIKSHYNSHNQMCVWIEEQKFAHFFKNVIVSFSQPNFTRTQVKIRYLLESEVQIKKQNTIMSILENISASAKNIFASKSQKRESGKSISGDINNLRRIPSIKVIQPVEQFKKVSKLVFVKFRVQNNKGSDYLSLAVKDNTNHTFCKIKKFKGWIDSGSKDISMQESNIFTPDLIKIQHKKGEYLCMFEVEFLCEIGGNESITFKSSQTNVSIRSINNGDFSINGKKQPKRPSIQIQKTIKKHELLVVCWSQDPIQLEHIEEQFGVIDCLQSWRKNSIKNWSFADKESFKSQGSQSSFKYISEKVGQKIILMTKSSKRSNLTLNFTGQLETKSIINDFIHEGQLLKIDEQNTNQIEIVQYKLTIGTISDSDHQEFQYVVIGGHDGLFQSIKQKNFELSFVD